MQRPSVIDVFRERVPTAFAFLSASYRFDLRREDDYAFTATSTQCEIIIELEWGSVALSLKPVGQAHAVRLAFIVGAVDPEILFLPRYPWGPDEAQDEIDRQARLLLEYCEPLLRGDFSRWTALEAHQQAVLDEWRRESERLVSEARVKLVRKRAEGAYLSRSYAEAARLYESIRESLSEQDRRRLDYARRRTILVAVPRQPVLGGLT